jgi:outer membrane lipoprotein-sorting protein
MKKVFMIVLAVLIVLAFVTSTFAQAPAPAPEKKAAVAGEKAKDGVTAHII